MNSIIESCGMIICSLFMVAVAAGAEHSDSKPAGFELLDGDRVVFVGNTFIERDQVYGYLETMLTARWPDRNITFRNLGWSGDTVWGEARARFGTAEDGFQHLKQHIEAIKPTVVFVGYGANEAFEGEAGLEKFEEGMNRLLDMIGVAAAPESRVILLSPLPQANLGPPLPNPDRHNEDLKRYARSIQRIAADRGNQLVDLYESALTDGSLSLGHTGNGLHLSASGYWKVATMIERALGIERDACEVRFRNGRPVGSSGTEISEVDTAPARLLFEMKHTMLPRPLAPALDTRPKDKPSSSGTSRSNGLPGPDYLLRANGCKIDEDELRKLLQRGGYILNILDYDQVEQLRQTVIEKNRLYFHRWRPQNETYLFGFRKHEQGQNAAEVPKFDPLVAELEAKIAQLRVPVKHTYELVREQASKPKHQIRNKSQ